jgi:glutamyl-tRNA reductase
MAVKNLVLKNNYLKDVFVAKEVKDLYLFTINHNTAPIPIREKFAIPEYNLKQTVENLKKIKSLDSFLALSTCNRTEIYFISSNKDKTLTDLYKFFSSFIGAEEKLVKEYSFILNGQEVVNHYFRLACGLESLVIGEKQILSQIKSAYTTAQEEHILGNTLERMTQYALKSAKEVHKLTNLSTNSPSISSAAVDLANKIAGPLKTKSVMVLGAGKMAKLALEQIVKIGGAKETVALNRSPHRVIEFPDKYKIDRTVPFDDIYKELNTVDVLICAAGAPHFIIFAEQFKEYRKDSSKSLHIFDLSLPRNIDSEFGKLSNVQLIDIDSIQLMYNKATQTNYTDIKNSEEIISKNIRSFLDSHSSEDISNLIKQIRERSETIRRLKFEKLSKNKKYFTTEEVDYITKNIVNSILHRPIKLLKKTHPEINYSKVVKEMLDLLL